MLGSLKRGVDIVHNQLKGACYSGHEENKTRSCETGRHLERDTHVPDGRIPQSE